MSKIKTKINNNIAEKSFDKKSNQRKKDRIYFNKEYLNWLKGIPRFFLIVKKLSNIKYSEY